MCDPVSIITSVVSAVVQQATRPRQREPEMPAPVTPPPQASRQADQQLARRSAQGGGGVTGAAAGTALTGTGGVAPSALNLGRNDLLGS